ncbi:uncharacterized protein LOC144160745 [Haemaphysalis longicornis]
MPPTYAYVEYKDGGRAIVAVSLIKDFEPATLEDTAQNKRVYWRSEVRQEEGFYPGDIVLLGLNKADLVTRMRKGHKPVPDAIFDAVPSISGSSHTKTSAEGAPTVPVAPGSSISSDRWEWLNKSKTDRLFVRDTVRTLWKPEALKDRSVTGKPCMAKLKAGAQGKRELTPEKLGAVRSAYGYFVKHHQSEAPTEKRLKAFNGYVANLLRDLK